MKEHIIRIGILVFSICIICILIYKEFKTESSKETVTLYFQIGDETIQTWEKEGVQYLFLPSYAKVEDVVLAPYSAEFFVIKDGKSILAKEDIHGILKEQKIDCQLVNSGKKFKLCIMQSEYIPAIFISTNSGGLEEMKEDKEYIVSGTLNVIEQSWENTKKVALKAMKTRGNSSFTGYDKKSFSITLNEAASILGLPAGKGYALISNASDLSLIRNEIVRRMEEALALPFSHTGAFVDLYVNGEYEGNYYLCDKLELGEERINIENMETLMNLFYSERNYESKEIYESKTSKAKKIQVYPKDISGGYLMEREYEQRFWLEYPDIDSAFITEEKECFVVKSPNYCSVEQIEYIQKYVNDAEKAMLSADGKNSETGKYYWEYIDVESFVKKYLAEEVSKNYDAGITSSFYYKESDSKGGKMKAAPGWDYDMSFGNYAEWMAEFSADPTGISKLAFSEDSSLWYAKLYDKPEFNKLVKQYYKSFMKPFLQELLDTGINYYENTLKASANMNEVRWKEEMKEHHLYEEREQVFKKLKEFIALRKEYLDLAWN